MQKLADISQFESLGRSGATSFDSSSVWNEDLSYVEEDVPGHFVTRDPSEVLRDKIRELEERCTDLNYGFTQISSLQQSIERVKQEMGSLNDTLDTLEEKLADVLEPWSVEFEAVQQGVLDARQEAGRLGESGGDLLADLAVLTGKLRGFQL